MILTTDDAGIRSPGQSFYDPFGQPIDPITGDIGTLTADDAGPNTLPGDDQTPTRRKSDVAKGRGIDFF